ncbi:GGDEF domain-containing protein [Sphingomonas sp. PAMC 26605]|uniref:GGDEF domain-containing protein n=1 Tax=Sphingomonas sp. PAMC 26605 TaxID=1112214 RepID=UPI00026CA78E|nr:GGDEF domain-containing protein [Sphingomonas sp. PAMC 26605]
MRFYQATRFLFPRNYQLRIFSICFGAVHLPIVVFCLTELALARWDWRLFVPLLVATLVGTGSAIGALRGLLAPVSHATGLLQALQRGEPVPPVPTGGEDLVGDLLTSVARASAETRARVERLADAAEKDVLTGLRNRRGFMDAIAPLLREDRNSVVAMLDLDHFKAINDRHGHDEGDRVLIAFANRLRTEMRRSDLPARWGGEEFAVLLPDATLDEATEIVERLRASLHRDQIGRLGGAALTFSCGLAIVRDYASLAPAMRRADQALYAAKHAGRDRVSSHG